MYCMLMEENSWCRPEDQPSYMRETREGMLLTRFLLILSSLATFAKMASPMQVRFGMSVMLSVGQR